MTLGFMGGGGLMHGHGLTPADPSLTVSGVRSQRPQGSAGAQGRAERGSGEMKPKCVCV